MIFLPPNVNSVLLYFDGFNHDYGLIICVYWRIKLFGALLLRNRRYARPTFKKEQVLQILWSGIIENRYVNLLWIWTQLRQLDVVPFCLLLEALWKSSKSISNFHWGLLNRLTTLKLHRQLDFWINDHLEFIIGHKHLL